MPLCNHRILVFETRRVRLKFSAMKARDPVGRTVGKLKDEVLLIDLPLGRQGLGLRVEPAVRSESHSTLMDRTSGSSLGELETERL